MNEIVLKNPITNSIKESIENCSKRINIAVPFLSGFVKTILNIENTDNIIDKKIITRFDDSYINSFDLPTLTALLNCGFEIRYNNSIHLKLYIADENIYVTSSNFTKGGFEDNIELTIKVDKKNNQECRSIFNEIWNKCELNIIDDKLISSNLEKYELLKKRQNYLKKESKKITNQENPNLELDIQTIIDTIFNEKKDYSRTVQLLFEANKLRNQTRTKLIDGYNSDIFYVTEGNILRKQTLFYDFVYGYESQLAGTGLRESHFQSVFLHPNFEKVINYILPEKIGLEPWNFKDEKILKEFCNGIFDFDIPSYKETLPIRLATYFYPEILLPVYKLDHLKEICDSFGFKTDAETKGDKLYSYNSFLLNKMKSLPYENIIKSYIAYQVKFTLELLDKLKREQFDSILSGYRKLWMKNFIIGANEILIKLNKTQ
jgi:hypothetical protein